MRKLKLEELNRISIDEFKEAEKLKITVVLDDIRSGVNVGSVFRSSDAFRFEKIILCGISPTPPHKEIIRTAIGAHNSMKWEYEADVKNAVSKLKSEGKKILIIEQTDSSIPLASFAPVSHEEYVIILGNEVKGVDEELLPLADECIEIEQFGTKHSLNVSVCAGVVFWHMSTGLRG